MEAAPRELPPWLQRQNGAASTSYSASYDLSEDTKDSHDVKSLGPEESKAAMEVIQVWIIISFFPLRYIYLCDMCLYENWTDASKDQKVLGLNMRLGLHLSRGY